MGMLGLSFIAQAITNAQRGQKGRPRRISSLKTMIRPEGELTEDETALLVELKLQLKNSDVPVSDKTCPECSNGMVRLVAQDVELDCCPSCRGIWFDPGELQVFSGYSRDVPGSQLATRQSKYNCPVCDQLMRECVFLKPYNLLVDRCAKGCGVYLEDRELERVFKLT